MTKNIGNQKSQPRPFAVYIDQCFLSKLRHGDPDRDPYINLVQIIRDDGGIPVFSRVHEAEILQSDRAEEFIKILEEIDAGFLLDSNLQNNQIELEVGRPRDHIKTEFDPISNIERSMTGMLKFMNFIQGGLGDIEPEDLLKEISDEAEAALIGLTENIPPEWKGIFTGKAQKSRDVIHSIQLPKLSAEAAISKDALIANIPNYAQVDELPDDEVVDYLLTCLDQAEEQQIRQIYPKGFWRNPEREYGTLAGFSFMLCSLGLVRDRRTRSGKIEKRNQHYLGQFRDCEHIEHASRCHLFLTRDRGAARLAKAVFAYAGSDTEVSLLSPKTPK